MFTDEKPDVQYSDIGGMDTQKQEIREAVELPLTHVELYRQIGIEPPRGVLMYGPPGCGKTMLAKAVAHHTTGISKLTFMKNDMKICYEYSCVFKVITRYWIGEVDFIHRIVLIFSDPSGSNMYITQDNVDN